MNIYEAQFPGSQDNLCLIYSPDFPPEEPSYLFRLFIYRLSPSLPRLHRLPAPQWEEAPLAYPSARAVSEDHDRAERAWDGHRVLHPISAWSGAVQDQGTAP